MARRSSGGRSARPAPRATSARPAPVHHTPPSPAQSGGGILSTIAEGMAFGTGSAVAHRAVDAIMGPRTIQHEAVVTEAAAAAAAPAPTANTFGSDACNVPTKAFHDCINSYGNDISKCQFYMDMLAECRKNSGASLSAA
ncbi:unnamed protein product [Sphenostylis stenocarpa]|uniref:CHCH domain-containing protein n=1 Tax=Sphenostylis stenocarpa TaxID=92480 RepID=A0AA86S6I3_9FABA|nr:unnamed protein product [Sphenostylis stenocarpa]